MADISTPGSSCTNSLTYCILDTMTRPKRSYQPLDPQLVIQAYANGIFPMADEQGKISWYAPNPRAILEHHHLHVSRSLRATIRKGIYEVHMDSHFEAVMRACADRDTTWINEEFIKTYTLLHRTGFAHSVETWRDGMLVGGLYGIALGGAFMGESMFSRATDASKVCLVALVEHLKARGYVLHDTQFTTEHLITLGVTEIPRRVYEQRLREALLLPCSWNDSSMKTQAVDG
jgi:leucyl/phenylalanyl-tRNA---protein transferase